MFQELDYHANISKIVGVQFSITSPDEIRRRSVAEIYTNETYDGDNPKVGGLFDPRLGVLDHGKKCPTDELDNRHCPGYFGHIELAKPVFHHHFLKYTQKTLQAICWKCSKLRINPRSEEIRKIISNKKASNRFTLITNLCSKKKRCGDCNDNGCGAIQPDLIKKESTSIGKLCAVWKGNKTKGESDKVILWEAEDVERMLRRISDEEIEVLGFNKNLCRPEWLIATVLPVAPPAVRPSVRSAENTRMEDDLTHKYCDILKTNKTLKYKLKQNAPKKTIDEWYQLLQYHVATLINNNLPGIPPAQQRSGRPLKAIADRLKSKEGRVRGNLMGKRVDKSARSVITPDPRLKLNELGVPYDICKNLTFPEKVNKYNIDRLQKYVINGNKYPGAKSYKDSVSKGLISLQYIDTQEHFKKNKLKIGDIVNRHLIKGDKVLFNRQPSLHKMSMMQHNVVPLPYKTFRLNVSVTTPYNADFDGDEMNMHVPQSEQSRIELNELASVQSQIITPAQHKPIIGLVQDTCVGSYLFTRYDNLLTKNDIMDIMLDVPSFNIEDLPDPIVKEGQENLEDWYPKYKYGDPPKQDMWSGRQMISMILPPISLKKKNKSYDNNESIENLVNILNGNIESGVFDKKIIGSVEGGLIHVVFNECGKDRTQQLLDDIQNIITNWMLKSGFSVGIGDLIPDQYSKAEVKKIVEGKKKYVEEIIDHVHKGILEKKGGKQIHQEFENQILSQLNKTMADTGKEAMKHLSFDNRMKNMIISGSKGSDINMGQMIACVGQQAVDGKRIPYGFTDRTLPHFHKYDDGAAARGFVESSFMDGLTPTEFFFHAMGGREGLIDTAVKTSETGYIQRKLIKGMEDARIVSDYTVRNASGVIIQFLYGEDGYDGAKIERVPLYTLNQNDKQIMNEHYFEWNDFKFSFKDNFKNEGEDYPGRLNKRLTEHVKQIILDRDYYFNNVFKDSMNNTIYCPINFKRLINNAKNNYSPTVVSDLDPCYVLDKIDELSKKLIITDKYKGNEALIVLMRIYLSPKKLILDKISKTTFDWIIANINQLFFSSIAVPGELVGTIAAQSIGEPSTQMTLNTFHFAGVGSKATVNQGVPRFKELLSVSKNLKSPMVTVTLNEPYCYKKDMSLKIMNELAITTIKQLTKSTEIFYDCNNKDDLCVIDESLNLEGDNDEEVINKSPWILKFEFDKLKMMDKNIKMSDIYFAIISRFNNNNTDLDCICSDDNSENLVMRIKSISDLTDETEESDEEDMICVLKSLEKTILNEIILTGKKNIKSASMNPNHNNKIFNNDTGSFEQKTTWSIYTEGSNLQDVAIHPNVNPYKTISNDIYEVYDLLGIEAARQVLIKEITEVFESAGAYVNFRHINLLVDIITNRGSLMSIDRHGINKSDRGPLAKCSFEETPDIIAKAAIFGELDKIKSVSSNIMLGQEVPIGTGSVDVLFDEEKIKDLIIDDSHISYQDNIDKEVQKFCNNLFD